MTTIKIDDTYRVKVDSYNFTLIKHLPVKETNSPATEIIKAYDKVLGYYPSLHHALIGLKREKVATDLDNVTIDEYVNELRKLEDWTGEILNEKKKQKA